jgi:tetratricopeptide (TPR) repeat protein
MKKIGPKLYLFFCCVFFLKNIAFSQFSSEVQKKIDSLGTVIKQNPWSIGAASSYVALSDILYLSNVDTVIPLCKAALAITNEYQKTATADNKNAILKIRALALNNIGYVYNDYGSTAKALENYIQGLKIRESISDKKGIAESLNNIGLICKNQGNIDKALEYYQKSLAIRKETLDKSGIANVLMNMAVLYDKQGDDSLALEYYLSSLKIYEELENKTGIANIDYNLGVIYYNKGDLQSAKDYYYKSLTSREDIGDKKGMASTLYSIAKIELELNNVSGAKKLALKSSQLANELGFPASIMNASNLLYKIYNKEQNWKEALRMHEMYTQMRDSVFSEENTQMAVRAEMNYEFDKKEAVAKIEEDKKQALALAETRKQKIVIYAITTGLTLLLILAIVIFRSLRINQQKNKIITQQKELVEGKQKEIIDSITYARRIQRALLPTEKYIERNLPKT